MSTPQSSLRDRINAAQCDKIPPGWYTLPQVASRERCSVDYAGTLVRQAIAARPPLMEKRAFRVCWSNNTRKRLHYRYL